MTDPIPARAAVVGPFSGPRAAWGELLKRAAAAHDGVHWELHDDRGEAPAARAAAEAIVADGRYALVIGHFNSAGARAALPVYRAAGLPVLLPLATAPRLLAGLPGAALRWCPDDLTQMAELRSAIGRAGHERMAVTDDGSAYGMVLAQLLLALPGAAPQVSAADDAATALVVCGTHVGAARIARARREAGFAGAFYFTDDCAVAEFGELLGDATGQAFVARLRGGAPARVEAAFAAAARALAAVPGARGQDLLAAVRAHADRQFTQEGEPEPPGAGWEVAPVGRAASSAPDLRVTERTRLRRMREKGSHRRADLDNVLASGFLCHLGVSVDGAPMVVPTVYGVLDDILYLHGSVASRSLVQAAGAAICVTVTQLDGLVLARSVFEHGVNYRCAMIFAVPRLVLDPGEKLRGLRALTEQGAPGQWDYARLPSRKELAATSLLAVELTEASVKMRCGPPDDGDGPDAGLGLWAGVLPVSTVWGTPVPDPALGPAAPGVPTHVAARAGRRLGRPPGS